MQFQDFFSEIATALSGVYYTQKSTAVLVKFIKFIKSKHKKYFVYLLIFCMFCISVCFKQQYFKDKTYLYFIISL